MGVGVCVCVCVCAHMLKARKSEVCVCGGGAERHFECAHVKVGGKKELCACVSNKRGTIQYNFIAKCQYTDCTRT